MVSRGDGELGRYLVMVEDGTFFYTELNGFDIKYQNLSKLVQKK
nr:hypothetical protein [Okeania sp. SIO2C9]